MLTATTTADRELLIYNYIKDFFTRNLGLDTGEGLDFDKGGILGRVAGAIGIKTGGYVAADLRLLCSEVYSTYTSSRDGCDSLNVDEMLLIRSFHAGMERVKPSCLRGITVSVPDNVWCCVLYDLYSLYRMLYVLCTLYVWCSVLYDLYSLYRMLYILCIMYTRSH